MLVDIADDTKRNEKIDAIIEKLGDHSVNLSHARHLSYKNCHIKIVMKWVLWLSVLKMTKHSKN